LLAPLVARTGGGTALMSDGDILLRSVRPGRPAAGRGWLGITPRGAYRTAEVSINPLLPSWAWLLIAAGLSTAAWLREGRR